MGNIVTVEANNILNASVAGGTYTPAPTTPVNLALVTVIGTATTPGTEVSGGSYARVSTAAKWGSAAAGAITNSAGTLSFTGMPACTIVGIELWDSAGTPIRRWWGVLGTSGTPVTKVVNVGDTVSFATSSISISLS